MGQARRDLCTEKMIKSRSLFRVRSVSVPLFLCSFLIFFSFHSHFLGFLFPVMSSWFCFVCIFLLSFFYFIFPSVSTYRSSVVLFYIYIHNVCILTDLLERHFQNLIFILKIPTFTRWRLQLFEQPSLQEKSQLFSSLFLLHCLEKALNPAISFSLLYIYFLLLHYRMVFGSDSPSNATCS